MKLQMKKYLQVIFSFLLIPLSLLICIALLELLLMVSFFDGEDNPNPIYIPIKFKQIHAQINEQNKLIASHHKYGFNDLPRKYVKSSADIVRIAVLGDSFVWSVGVDYDTSWNHQLEKLFLDKYENVEVLSWGKGGWSTKRQVQFLKKHGWKYHVDLLIVGFVTNDPDLGNIPQKHFNSSRYFDRFFLLRWVKVLFPNSVVFITAHINRLVEMYDVEYGYKNWEEKLYTPQNLQEYKNVLRKQVRFCQIYDIKLLYVMTPNNYKQHFQEKYSKIIPIFKELKINYLNLYPVIYERLHTYNTRKLWANLADGHPGNIVTSIYAEQVFNYLTQSKQIDFFLKGKKLKLLKPDTKSRYISGQEILTNIENN